MGEGPRKTFEWFVYKLIPVGTIRRELIFALAPVVYTLQRKQRIVNIYKDNNFYQRDAYVDYLYMGRILRGWMLIHSDDSFVVYRNRTLIMGYIIPTYIIFFSSS